MWKDISSPEAAPSAPCAHGCWRGTCKSPFGPSCVAGLRMRNPCCSCWRLAHADLNIFRCNAPLSCIVSICQTMPELVLFGRIGDDTMGNFNNRASAKITGDFSSEVHVGFNISDMSASTSMYAMFISLAIVIIRVLASLSSNPKFSKTAFRRFPTCAPGHLSCHVSVYNIIGPMRSQAPRQRKPDAAARCARDLLPQQRRPH